LDDRSAKDAMRSILEGPLSHLRSQDLSDYTDADLTVGDLADGKPVRLGDLLQGNKDQLAQLARLKLTPDTQVKAKVRLQISVNRVAKEGSGWKRIRGLPIGIVDGG
jgi:hypothetical protein